MIFEAISNIQRKCKRKISESYHYQRWQESYVYCQHIWKSSRIIRDPHEICVMKNFLSQRGTKFRPSVHNSEGLWQKLDIIQHDNSLYLIECFIVIQMGLLLSWLHISFSGSPLTIYQVFKGFLICICRDKTQLRASKGICNWRFIKR